ncbi:hypothetical protein RclHR1_05900009 [Rhizophagus clarus]|uniref:Geminivirus AL1 replication-associated protein central domain-containing protein n=1 Tax=Rhizophagus clarus TaxID=94130 RepID=A0A2Z6S7Y2_9GLOM|nr:hypothetical protein RclHR1_05900009 [Rhizophagus clarus]
MNVRNFNVAKKYVRKEWKENIQQAKWDGNLIEDWPQDMNNAGRNKRKQQFEDDDIHDAVKRSKMADEFLQEVNVVKPAALASNFNNLRAYANWVLPAQAALIYRCDFNLREQRLPKEVKWWVDNCFNSSAGRLNYKSLVLFGGTRLGKTEWTRNPDSRSHFFYMSMIFVIWCDRYLY